MQEILAQLFSFAWGVWRHRWLALIVSWSVAIAGWAWVWQLPESYVATARVYVDTNTLLKPLLQGLTIQPNTQDRIGLLSRTLLSRPNLEKLMRMTDLDLEVSDPAEQTLMISNLKESISLYSGEQKAQSLYTIDVEHPDRETAKRIAQALLTIFIEGSLSGKREDADGSLDYLDEKIQEYEDNLVESEAKVARFKQQHFDIVGSEAGFYATLNSERKALEDALRAQQEEENRAIALESQIAGEDPLYNPLFIPAKPSSGGRKPTKKELELSKIPTPYDQKIVGLVAAMDDLNLKYTPRHPEVRQAKTLLKEMNAERDTYQRKVFAEQSGSGASRSGAVEMPGPAVPYSSLTSSPVYLEMRMALSTATSNIASFKSRVDAQQERVAELEAQVDSIPGVENELRQMEREIGLMAEAHSTMTSKRALARLGQDVEEKASSVTFRVIDPPFVPLMPSEPDKLLLNALVLGVAVAAGVGIGLLVSLIAPVIIDPHTLVAITGLPVLGSVRLNLKNEEKQRERFGILAFYSLTAFLPVIFLVISAGQSTLFV
ncbi:MAG: chain length-determining protein [Halieaceae bacterium]|nr:chain length-determining protein [Halieaceae bacterium]